MVFERVDLPDHDCNSVDPEPVLMSLLSCQIRSQIILRGSTFVDKYAFFHFPDSAVCTA